MKIAPLLYRAAIVISVLLAGCTYGPVKERAEIINGWISTDSSTLYTAVRKSNTREPTGLSTFPDGGSSLILSQEVRIFRSDLVKGSTTLLKIFPAPDTVWESFEPRIWSVAEENVYVLLTGCPKGGECFGSLNKREFYLIDSRAKLLKIYTSPEPQRNTRPGSLTVSVYSDRIEIRSRYEGNLLYRFILNSREGTLNGAGA